MRTIDSDGEAADDAGAHEREIGRIERIGDDLRGRLRAFLARHGFAGQRRLIDIEVFGGEKPQVGGDHVARGKAHNVAGHELFARQLIKPVGRGRCFGRIVATTTHARGDFHHGAQSRRGVVGAMLLDERQENGERDDHQDHDGGVEIAEAVGSGGEREQQRVERIAGAINKFAQRARRAILRDEVWTASRQPRGGFRAVQTFKRAAEMSQNFGFIHAGDGQQFAREGGFDVAFRGAGRGRGLQKAQR